MAVLSKEERQLLRSSLRDFFASEVDEKAVRNLIETDSGVDFDVWRRLVGSLALAGILVPEKHGGLGLDYAEAMVVLEEGARALYSGPLFSSAILAPSALLATSDADACARYLPGLADGSRLAALCIDDVAGRAVMARSTKGRWSVKGKKTAVIDGAHADLLLVIARDEAGRAGLFAVDPGDGAVEIEALDVFDRTRRQAAMTFDDAAAIRLGGDFGAGQALVADVGAAAAAAEQVGISQKLLEIAVDYARVREQFGRPIGSFQAVKHLCADMLVRVECLRAAARASAAALDGEDVRIRAESVSVAKAYGSDGATFVAETTIQVLGGIGYTWEHPAHLYLRRARSLRVAFGDPLHHRSRIAALAGFGQDGLRALAA